MEANIKLDIVEMRRKGVQDINHFQDWIHAMLF
jgi:hypothetical protein